VTVGTPEGDPQSRCGLAALGLPHGSCADPATTDSVATCHGVTPCMICTMVRSPLADLGVRPRREARPPRRPVASVDG
jgi:hypothetical protein